MFKLMKVGPYGSGGVILEKCQNSKESNMDWNLGIPHEISFVNNKGERFKLFSCYISITHLYFIIEDLDYHEDISSSEEAIIYYFLNIVIENAPSWAKTYKRENVVVESSLPHITEHFLEHKFSIRSKDLMGADKGYRGFKITAK